jgi:hypothetical protein
VRPIAANALAEVGLCLILCVVFGSAHSWVWDSENGGIAIIKTSNQAPTKKINNKKTPKTTKTNKTNLENGWLWF